MKFNYLFRVRFASFLVLIVALLFLSRLFFLQVVKNDTYTEKADRQYLSPSANIFNRGSIFFTTKNGELVSAAGLNQGSLLAINPKILVDKEDAYQKLSVLIPLEHDDFINRISKPGDTYEQITDRLETATSTAISDLKIKGVSLYKDKWRFYPAGELASHVIGFMGYQGDLYTGRYGLEKYYNDVLARNSNQNFVNFFAEIFLGLGQSFQSDNNSKDKGEGDIILTIEPAVQTYLEKELSTIKDQYRGEYAGGIIMDPQTGEIVAMASLPNFNPGGKQTDVSLLRNPSVEDVYEMGSIMKPLTIAMGIDLGVVSASSTYYDKGYLILNKKRINNSVIKERGITTMQEVLNQSLNTGASHVALKAGHDNFRRYFNNYGFGERTGIDLPNEVPGLIKNLDSKLDVDYATASFGQGIAVSPIEMIRALASLANGGKLVRPHVVRTIKYKTLLEDNIKPEVQRQVLKKETTDDITRMLVTVVDKALLQGKVSMPNFSIAAKTGTAQTTRAGFRGYEENAYFHTFFGYFPAYNSRFIIFLYIMHPQGVTYASATLTQPFINMTKFLINYYEIPPDRQPAVSKP